MRSRPISWYLSRGGLFLASLVMMLYLLFPFLWLLISSIKLPVELFAQPPKILPQHFTLANYIAVLADRSITSSIGNSLIVACFSTVLALAIGTLAGYAFARFRFPGRGAAFLIILATQMLPQMAVLIPLFILMQMLGLLYTYSGMIVANVALAIPYVCWMVQAFFVTVPPEVEEAARVDGCSRLGAMYRVLLPMSASGLVATAIFVFIGAWNEFLFATVMTNAATKVFPVRLAEFMGGNRVAYEGMFPASVLGSIPPLLLVLVFQRWLVRGLTEGGVKM